MCVWFDVLCLVGEKMWAERNELLRLFIIYALFGC